jgi:hypothetical protein
MLACAALISSVKFILELSEPIYVHLALIEVGVAVVILKECEGE